MPPRGLTVDDNATEVALCNWHLRKIFNGEHFMEMLETGQMAIVASTIKERKYPSKDGPSLADAPYTEEFIIADTATNQETVRCQRFLKSDGKTLAASGKADPKEINWKGQNYHQLGK